MNTPNLLVTALIVAGIPLWFLRTPPGHVVVLPSALQNPVCSPDATRRDFVERDSAGARIVESAAVLSAPQISFRVAQQPSVTIGGPNNYRNFFSKVGPATRLSDGNIVVADLAELSLVVFNARSETVRQIGRKGQGPGEFERISSLIRLPGDTLIVADSPGRRLTYFRPNGTLIRVVDLANISLPRAMNPRSTPSRSVTLAQIAVVARFGDGSFLLTTTRPTEWEALPPPPNVRQTSVYLHHLDPRTQRTDTVGKYTTQPWFALYPHGAPIGDHAVVELRFAATGSIAAIPEGFYETSGDRYEIRKRDTQGRLAATVRWCRPPVPLTPAEINRWRAAQNPRASEVYKRMFAEAADRVQYPRTKPAFTQLLVDSEQRIWAREFGLEMDEPIYHVFDRNGRYLSNVRMPRDVEIMEIGRDYVLAHDINEDDIDRILVYPLQQLPR